MSREMLAAGLTAAAAAIAASPKARKAIRDAGLDAADSASQAATTMMNNASKLGSLIAEAVADAAQRVLSGKWADEIGGTTTASSKPVAKRAAPRKTGATRKAPATKAKTASKPRQSGRPRKAGSTAKRRSSAAARKRTPAKPKTRSGKLKSAEIVTLRAPAPSRGPSSMESRESGRAIGGRHESAEILGRDPRRRAGHAHALRHPQGAAPDRRQADAAASARRRSRRWARSERVVVVGKGREQVEAALAGRGVAIALQAEQKGTAHAVQQAAGGARRLRRAVLILYGDTPFVDRGDAASGCSTGSTATDDPGVVVLASSPADGKTYGRVILGDGDRISKMVEYKDATEAERAVKLCNSGMMAVRVDGPVPLARPRSATTMRRANIISPTSS